MFNEFFLILLGMMLMDWLPILNLDSQFQDFKRDWTLPLPSLSHSLVIELGKMAILRNNENSKAESWWQL